MRTRVSKIKECGNKRVSWDTDSGDGVWGIKQRDMTPTTVADSCNC